MFSMLPSLVILFTTSETDKALRGGLAIEAVSRATSFSRVEYHSGLMRGALYVS